MFENFTDRARRVIVYATKEAQQVGADYVGTDHLLLGLHKEPTGLAAHALRECSAGEDAMRAVFLKLGVKVVPVDPLAAPSPLPFTPQAKHALEESIAKARQFGHPYIGTEHILLGLLKASEGLVAEVLRALEVAPSAIVVCLYNLLGFDPRAYPEAKKVEEPKPVTMEELNSISNFAMNQATAVIASMLQEELYSAGVDAETAGKATDSLVSRLINGGYPRLAYFVHHNRRRPDFAGKLDTLTPERIAEMDARVRGEHEFTPQEQNEIVSRILGRA